MDNIIKSSINKIKNFVSSRINDQQGLIQRNPQTGVRSFNVKAVPQTVVQSVPAINIASFTANKINQALTSPNLFKGQKMSIAEGVKQLPKVGIGKLTTEFGEVLRGQRYATGEKIPENLQIVPKIPVLSGLTRVSSQLGEQIGKPVAQTAVGLGQIATKGTKQEGIKNIVLGAGGTALNILGPRFVNPTFLAANIGIGGVIGLGTKVYENITQKKPITEGLLEQTVTQGILSGQRGIAMSPLLKFTQPAIEKIGTLAQTSKLFNRLSPVVKQQVLDRMIASVLNVGEGLIIDKSLGLTTDKTSVGIDAVVGALMGTRAVSGQNRAIRQAFKDLNKRATDIFNAELKKTNEPTITDSLLNEARKYKSAEEFVKAQGDTLYHGTPYNFTEFKKGNTTFFTPDKKFAEKYGSSKSQAREMDADVKIMERQGKLNLFDSTNPSHVKQIEKLLPDEVNILGAMPGMGGKVSKSELLERLQGIFTHETPEFASKAKKVGEVFDDMSIKHEGEWRIKEIKPNSVVAEKISKWHPGKVFRTKEFPKKGTYQSKGDPYWKDFEGDTKLEQAFKDAGFDGFKMSENGSITYGVFDANKLKTKSQLTDIWKKANKATPEASLLAEARKYKSAEEFVNKQLSSETGMQIRDRGDINNLVTSNVSTNNRLQHSLNKTRDKIVKQLQKEGKVNVTENLIPLDSKSEKLIDTAVKNSQDYKQIEDTLNKFTSGRLDANKIHDRYSQLTDIYNQAQQIKPTKARVTKSIEQLAEEATGFKPGLKRQFDTALVTKNKEELQRLLPNVPQEYAQRYKTVIDNILTPKVIEPVLKKDGTIEVKTNQPTVEMPKNMSTIEDIFKNRKSELLSTFKTPDEIKLKYIGEKRIKVSGSNLKNKLINAFKNQGKNTFDINKADTALNYVTNKINEKRLKQIITESGINRLEKNSIKNFWNLVRKELSKNPAYKEDYEEIWKSLLDSEKYFNTKNETIKPIKKLIPIKEEIEQLNNFPSKTEVYGKEAEVNYKNYVNKANNIIERISNGLKYYKIGKKEFIRYIENPNTAPENIKEIIDYHNYLMDIAHASRENPMLGKIQSYYPHMSDGSLTQRQDIKRLGDDLWISSTNMQLGTALKRLGLMKEYSLEYEKVMRNYFEQAAYEKYGSRIKFNEQTNSFVNKLETHLKRDSEGLLERPNNNFDYIDESSIRQNIEIKKPIFARFLPIDTFDSLRRKIERDPNGKKLSYTMALLRDSDDQINNFIKEADGKDLQTQIKLYKRIDTKGRNIVKERDRLTTNELILLGNYEKKYRLQNFIDEVGKLDFEDNVKNYLNKEIDRLTKKGEYEQSLATQLSSFLTGLAYRAQIWFNVNTALLQKSEVLRLPVLYSPQTIKQGAEQYINDLSTRRDILKQYDFNSITTDQTKFLGEENVLVNNKVGKLKQFGKNVDEIAGKFGNFLIDLSENSKNRDLLYTMEAQGKSLGLQGEDLYRFVRNEMFANSFILHEFNTPEIIRNPFFRVLLQYMQYPIKMYSRAWELGTTNPNKVKGITQGAALIGTQGVAAILLAYITGKSLEKLNETFADALTIRFGPIPTTLFNLAKSGKELYDNEVDKDKTEEQKQNSKEYIQNQINRYLISTGIPGSNQWRKTTGALSVINKGYDETFGGNITYPSPENKFDQIRGLLFGKTSFPENKEYYRATQDVTEFGGKRMQEAYSIGTNEFSKEKAEVIRELYKEGKREEGRNFIELERKIQKARKESYDALTDIEKQALNSIPKQEPDDIQARMTKYRNMIQYPAIYDKKKFDALVAANGDLTKVDPLYTYNYEYVYKYMLYQSFGGSTLDNSNADELFEANPVILEISKARAAYYKNNPIEGLTQDSLRPLPSERAQALMNAKMWNDPEVQVYLKANKEYKNYIRGKLGLPTIEEFEFISRRARGKGGRKTKVKKIRFGKVKKIKLKKPKTFKVKKLKLPKIKAIEAPKTKVLTKKNRIKVKIPKLPKTIKAKVI